MDAPETRRWIPVVVTAAILFLPSQSLAGPPLLCQPFDIGGAKSLPWGHDGWNSPAANYAIDRLVPDTLALLSPDTPVLERMETMRRAAIYASRDVRLAADLLSALSRRALERNGLEANRHAWFDFGYLVETYKQAGFLFKNGNPADGMDGYRHVKKALDTASTVEPEMEFAAALITERQERGVAAAHFRKATSAAKPDSLLARNLPARLPEQ
jgi:hypothetical protein